MRPNRNPHRRLEARRFFDPDGREIESVNAATMREIDRIALEETGPNLYQMMENAGRSVATFVMEKFLRIPRRMRILVLAGPGGNGGGGICAARHLVNHGVQTTVVLAGEPSQKSIVRDQLSIYRHAKGALLDADEWSSDSFDLVVDALLGYSLKGSPALPFATLIRRAKEGETPVLSLDVPSGVDATTGEVPGDFLRARWTLTLALPKSGLASKTAGRIYLADLGIPDETFHRAGIRSLPRFGRRYWIPLACRPFDSPEFSGSSNESRP